MRTTRRLIVNADDFGQSDGVNRGVIEAHQRGIVTSASLMVRWPASEAAAQYARNQADLSLGLHVDLGEHAFRNGRWVRLYSVVPPDDRRAVADEVARQLATFRRLAGRDPTHLDAHQHVHREDPVRSVLLQLAGELRIPLRLFSSSVCYWGDFYGQSADGYPLPELITAESLLRIVERIPAGQCIELGCHPGFASDLDTMYREERALEVAVLCDPRVRAGVAARGVELCSFHAVAEEAD